jgi:poly-gamma-glutamate synthesis protein (capsule biosynthesis protein)
MSQPKITTWIKPLPDQMAVSSSDQCSIIFAGDFYQAAGSSITNVSSVFEKSLSDEIRSASAAGINLEGPLAGNGKPIPKVGPHLRLHRRSPATLKELGFNIVTLANNHLMDYGPAALEDTIQTCRAAGLQTVGAGLDSERAMQPIELTLPNGLTVQMFSFCEREFGISEDSSPGAAWLSRPEVEESIRQAKSMSDVVIVCAHGGNEEVPLPSFQRRDQLRKIVEIGADLVIGHHPHVPQGWEQWGEGYIFYSLGDFYFDAINGNRYDHMDWGFMVRVVFGKQSIQGLEIITFERIQNKLSPLGTKRDLDSYIGYLHRLAELTSSNTFMGYWQEIAVRLMWERYYPFFWEIFLNKKKSPAVSSRLRKTIDLLREMIGVWLGDFRRGTVQSDHVKNKISQWQTLLLVVLLRCESHRWAIETALAILGEESEDLRTPEIRKAVSELLHWTGL